jgi:6-phosphogluconolactonase
VPNCQNFIIQLFFLTFEHQIDRFMKNILCRSIFIVLACLACCMNAHAVGKEEARKEIVYIGTFSERGSLGIYVYEVFRENMRFDLLQTIISKASPSFLAISPGSQLLFSANRAGMNEDDQRGSITSFAIDQQTGKLTKIQDQSSYGESPCHISVHPSGNYLFVCHYKGGNLVVLPVDQEGLIGKPVENIQFEGSGTIMPQQSQPHPHSAIPSPDGRYLYVSDLGQDKIHIYEIDEVTGKLKAAQPSYMRTMPGSGPRHFTFHPNGKIAFSSEEISSSISSYKVNDEDGSLQLVQRLPSLPPAFFGENSSADVHTAVKGKYVYISNRGYNGLAMFKVSGNGKMKSIGYMPTIGRRPRSFMPDPEGEFMLVGNRDSDEINIFTIERDGTLKDTSAYLPVPSSSCILYLELR